MSAVPSVDPSSIGPTSEAEPAPRRVAAGAADHAFVCSSRPGFVVHRHDDREQHGGRVLRNRAAAADERLAAAKRIEFRRLCPSAQPACTDAAGHPPSIPKVNRPRCVV